MSGRRCRYTQRIPAILCQGRHESRVVHSSEAKVMSVLTIKARMYINLGVLATAMVLVCAVALSAFSDSSRRMQQLHDENMAPIAQINEIYQRSLQSQQYRLEAYVHRDPAFTQENYAKVKENRGRINELTEAFSKYPLTDEERDLLKDVKDQRGAIVDAGKKEIE